MMRLARPSFETLLTFAFVLIGLAWGAFLGARQIAGTGSALDRLENLTLDWRFALAGARSVPRGVVIAAIDDETIRAAGGYPLPRQSLANIVRELAARDAQAIAIDLLFLDAGDPAQDAALADALRATRTVVAAVGLFDRNGSTRGDAGPPLGETAVVPQPSSILWPIAAVREAARSGLVNLSTDHAGVPRYVPMIFRTGDGVMPSFALAAASSALATEPVLGAGTLKLAARTVRTDFGYHLPIRYYGPRDSIRQLSAARALRGELDPDEVRGQLVLLGATAVGLGDKFATPFDSLVPGVEIFATAITNLLAGDGLVTTGPVRTIDPSAAFLLPAVTVLLMAMRRLAIALALAGIVIALWAAATVAAFFSGYWLSIAVPLAATLPVAAAFGLARLVHAHLSARRLAQETAALRKFQSPRLVEHIVKHPRFLEQPVHQHVAVVFLDLSGFTGLAEAIGPEWARNLLADFHAIVERDVVAHDGFVVSFMGDGVMTVFGVPESHPDDAARAFRAILELRRSIASWLAGLPPVARDRLEVRIGGHAGAVVVSLLGPAHHQHITATGDTVNVTSRLLEVAKQLGCGVVVSEELWTAADASTLVPGAADAAREVAIRGRRQPISVRTLR